MEICMIAAVADNMAIGRDGDMPWHLPEDLKFFKKTTMGCPVIMGRRTWMSLPRRPLPGRRNIVLTGGSAEFEGAETAASLQEAYSLLEGSERCFVIGGGSVYRAALEDADMLYITHIHASVEDADTFFPEFDLAEWTAVESSETYCSSDGVKFEFVTYKRTNRRT